MSEDFGTPITPMQEPKKRNTTLIIVIVLLAILCACCAFILLFYFYLGDLLLEWLDSQGLLTLRSILAV